MNRLIIDLNLNKKNVLVIGAGKQGIKKIQSIINSNCNITIIDEHINQIPNDILSKPNVTIIKEKVIVTDTFLNRFEDLFMIFVTTDNKKINREIIKKGKEKKILVYSSDNPKLSDFSVLSTTNIDKIINIAISTSGKSPLMTKILILKIQNNLKNIIGENDIKNIKIQEFARKEARKYIVDQQSRKNFLYSILNNGEIQHLINENKIKEVKETIISKIIQWEDIKGR